MNNEFGGSIGSRSSQNTYYYSSANPASAKRVIQYFDRFHLMGAKQIQYVLWRKVYSKIQEDLLLTLLGVKWITNVKKRLSLAQINSCKD